MPARTDRPYHNHTATSESGIMNTELPVAIMVAGNAGAGEHVESAFPETGVTNARPAPQTQAISSACCGGPPPAGIAACCSDDAVAKAAGKVGCGCAPESK